MRWRRSDTNPSSGTGWSSSSRPSRPVWSSMPRSVGPATPRRSSTQHHSLQVLGLDRDPDAVDAARAALARFGDRAVVEHRRFDDLAEAVSSHREVLGGVIGVLFDLGVSSPQLDRAERGFSFRQDGPLDMRMDPTSPRDRPPTSSTTRLPRSSPTSSGATATSGSPAASPGPSSRNGRSPPRGSSPTSSPRRSLRPARRKSKGHPARRTFQAIRIEVNQELEVLADALDQAIAMLQPGGRCVAMSYHSGEDRIVKERFRKRGHRRLRLPAGAAVRLRRGARGDRFVVRGAEKASADEIAANPRCRERPPPRHRGDRPHQRVAPRDLARPRREPPGPSVRCRPASSRPTGGPARRRPSPPRARPLPRHPGRGATAGPRAVGHRRHAAVFVLVLGAVAVAGDADRRPATDRPDQRRLAKALVRPGRAPARGEPAPLAVRRAGPRHRASGHGACRSPRARAAGTPSRRLPHG